jgi:hypothetical protein
MVAGKENWMVVEVRIQTGQVVVTVKHGDQTVVVIVPK